MANGRVGAPKESTANGLATFSLHAKDEVSRTEVAALQAQPAAGGPVFGLAGDAQALDPETVARRYLDHALGSAAVPGLVAPSADGTPSVFKSLGVESIPLTGTTMVKFRQNFNNIVKLALVVIC